MQASRSQRVLTFLMWALVGLSLAYWGLRLGESAPASAPAVVPAALPPVDAGAVVAALGGGEKAVASPSARRIELLGVIAQGPRGVALLSIAGQPGRPYVVGARIDERLLLKAVGPRHAELAESASGPVMQRLEMPAAAPSGLPAGMALVQSR